MKKIFKIRILEVLLVVITLLFSAVVLGVEYHYVNWTTQNVAAGSASGTITLPDGSVVTVNFQAVNADGSFGNLAFAQTDGTGTNYWIPSTPYISSQVDNPPPDSDLLALEGGQNQTYKITLSEPIKDPIMAIVSLGRVGSNTTYVFDVPFTIVSQDSGYFGGSKTALEMLPGNTLQGNEGHGTIQFLGTFPRFSWTVPTPEYWHGFTFGIRTTERIEPSASSCSNPNSTLVMHQYLGVCGLTKTTEFSLSSKSEVGKIRIWYDTDIGTNKLIVTIKGPNNYQWVGETTKGSCDPYQAHWCEGNIWLNTQLEAGKYSVSINSSSMCTNPSGETTLFVYGCPVATTGAISQGCVATYKNGELHIPYVSVSDIFGGTLYYEADMKLIPFSNPSAFELTGAKPASVDK